MRQTAVSSLLRPHLPITGVVHCDIDGVTGGGCRSTSSEGRAGH